MLKPRVPVTFPNGSDWSPSIGAPLVSALLQRMASDDVLAIARTVFKALDLPSRRELAARKLPGDGRGDEDEDGGRATSLNAYRWQNRALSMELLASLLLAHLNRASKVRSFCLADGPRAYYFAGPGKPDVVADYPKSGDAPAFRVLAEVSAKRAVTPDHHLKQLGQALKHARSELGKHPGSPIHACVINNGDVGSDRELRRQYQKFVRDNGLLREGRPISVTAMHTADVAHALARLCAPPADGFGFPSGGMASALAAMTEGLMQDGTLDMEQGWMADLFVESVGVEAPELQFDPSSDDDGPPGTG